MSAYVSMVANKLKGKLPPLVTKEELMNYYIHQVKPQGQIIERITVINLVQAANLANIIVKGKSKLEVNVSNLEQWRYISTSEKTTSGKVSRKVIREKLYNNKDDIVAAYEGGATVKDLAYAWNVNTTTMHRYLREFGANMRSGGKRKIYSGSDAIVRGESYSYGKKKGRKQRA